jgi:hypothetical protein
MTASGSKPESYGSHDAPVSESPKRFEPRAKCSSRHYSAGAGLCAAWPPCIGDRPDGCDSTGRDGVAYGPGDLDDPRRLGAESNNCGLSRHVVWLRRDVAGRSCAHGLSSSGRPDCKPPEHGQSFASPRSALAYAAAPPAAHSPNIANCTAIFCRIPLRHFDSQSEMRPSWRSEQGCLSALSARSKPYFDASVSDHRSTARLVEQWLQSYDSAYQTEQRSGYCGNGSDPRNDGCRAGSEAWPRSEAAR